MRLRTITQANHGDDDQIMIRMDKSSTSQCTAPSKDSTGFELHCESIESNKAKIAKKEIEDKFGTDDCLPMLQSCRTSEAKSEVFCSCDYADRRSGGR
nr:hypothetical protein CFP56_38822 [Quercus suber]